MYCGTNPLAPGRIYSAAGDGYFESTDAGDSWRSPEDGLKHLYLVGVAVDPADPDAVIVSATDGPGSAYRPRSAEAYVYRKTGLKGWEQAMSGLPESKGTTASRFATHAGEPGVIYAANNRGFFRSDDAGRSWKVLDLPWPEPGFADGVEALPVFRSDIERRLARRVNKRSIVMAKLSGKIALVTGVTGKQGGAVVEALLTRGHGDPARSEHEILPLQQLSDCVIWGLKLPPIPRRCTPTARRYQSPPDG